ncbi:Isochorismatase hydrolase [Saccharata proteae CBS 121410]|uniref:Isochorismatase hydrolase n=1 Tax=Saccharata proteae CBS 121410 TaxID=1314787 RepID=A0A6A5YC23_9PEZI|nr:Isochorismatase hydrolase [Saccharata proteae CBS 121410]
MKLSLLPTNLLCALAAAESCTTAFATTAVSANTTTTTAVASASAAASSSPLSFGRHYAVLNLDLINGLVSTVEATTAGQAFINSTATWIDAVHAQSPPPISIWTRIYFFNDLKPEIKPGSGFEQVASSLGNATEDTTQTQIYDAFHVLEDYDVVLKKARYYAGTANALEQILRAQSIDTVILSGIRTSGVILSTTYRLFDLDYKVYVISDNVIENEHDGVETNRVILENIIPDLPASVITLEEALEGLKNSGPAVY